MTIGHGESEFTPDGDYMPGHGVYCPDGHCWTAEGFLNSKTKVFTFSDDDKVRCPECGSYAMDWLSKHGIDNPFQNKWVVECAKGHTWTITAFERKKGNPMREKHGSHLVDDNCPVCPTCDEAFVEILRLAD